MKRPVLYGLTLALALAASSRLAGEDRQLRKLLQDGKTLELVRRDIPSAIAIYERVLRESGDNTAVKAEALLRIGKAYKNTGEVKARSVLERLTREFSDRPEANEARTLLALLNANRPQKPVADDSPELFDHAVWNEPQAELTGRVSFDGRLLSFVDRNREGALAVFDLSTRASRVVVGARSGRVGPSAISRSGREIAYAWQPGSGTNDELHVVGIDGLRDRHLFSNTGVTRIHPMDWTPDGRIVALISTQDGASQIAVIHPDSRIEKRGVFLGSQEPANLAVSPDWRFIAYDAPQPEDPTKRDISTVSLDGGIIEYPVVKDRANDRVLGWTTDSRLLFASDRSGSTSVWAIQVQSGKPSNAPPIRVKENVGDVRTLGTTRANSLIYSPGATQVRTLENVLPELARLQLASLQQVSQSPVPVMGSIEGIVVKRGTNEPLAGVDVELTRVEGTKSSPLSTGAAEVFARLIDTGENRVRVGPEPPAALAPELQYAKTGENGRFVFRNLKPGNYRLVAARYGDSQFPARYGQRDPRGPGLSFPLAEGQSLRDARLEMAPLSVITGRVFDVTGQPLGHATVYAMTHVIQNGERILMSNHKVLSDDRGEYRLFGMAPGRYYIAVKAQEQSELLYPPPNTFTETGGSPVVTTRKLPDGNVIEESYGLLYHGDVLDPSRAAPVDVGLGVSAVSAADIHMSAALIRSFHVRGVLNNAAGQPLAGIQVRAVPREREPHVFIPFTLTDSRGEFDLAGVVPGNYAVLTPLITVRPTGQRGAGAAPPEQISANANVQVGNANIESLQLVASVSRNIRGQVLVDGRISNEPGLDLRKTRIVLDWDPDVVGMPNPGVAVSRGSPASATVAADGTFGLAARSGNYRITVNGLSPNAFVKSIRLGDVDILANGLRINDDTSNALEIIVTEAAGTLNGSTVGSNGAPMRNVVVALVPDAPTPTGPKNFRSTNSDASGTFTLQAIPPGAYRIYAWEYVEPGAWQDAQFMQPYQTLGKSLRITEGKNQDLQLTVIPISQ